MLLAADWLGALGRERLRAAGARWRQRARRRSQRAACACWLTSGREEPQKERGASAAVHCSGLVRCRAGVARWAAERSGDGNDLMAGCRLIGAVGLQWAG